MGLIGRLLSFTRGTRKGAEVGLSKVNPGGGYIVTCEHFGAPGDDGQPLPGDYVVTVSVPRTGVPAAVGYLDPVNAGQAGPGERRLYARNSSGAPVVSLWLKADGSITVANENGSLVLQPGGAFVINGVTIDSDGNIDTAGNITSTGTVEGTNVQTAAGIDLGFHTHSGVTPGGGVSGPPVP